jgi:hypothetical protein
MNLQDFMRSRCFTSFATIVLGLSLAITARAQNSGTINQLFAFTCTNGSNGETCPEGGAS